VGRYLERVRSLERELTQPEKDASMGSAHGPSTPPEGHAINAVNAITSYPPSAAVAADSVEACLRQQTTCRACLCDEYVIRLPLSCPSCQGAVCPTCGGCLKASHAWRRAEHDALHTDLPLSQLLERLRKGSRWLQQEHQLFIDNTPDRTDDTLFSKMLHTWDSLEVALRDIHDYQGCVFGEGQRCPEGAPVRCFACAAP
jgi:hypothetical protein